MSKFIVDFYEKKNGEIPVKTLIVTNGFIKKTQKTPKREIKKAMLYRKNYIERHGDQYDIR